MKNWFKKIWDSIKELPVKTVATGGLILVGGAAVTWILTTILGKAFFRNRK